MLLLKSSLESWNLQEPAHRHCSDPIHPLEKNSELDDPEEAAVWYDLCLKQSSEIRGGDTATVTDDVDWAPESGGDSKNNFFLKSHKFNKLITPIINWSVSNS